MINNIYELINEYRNTFSEENESFSSPLIKSPNYDIDISNQFHSISQDKTLYKIEYIPSHYIINQIGIEKNRNIKVKKSTSIIRHQKTEENNEPKLFTPNDILNIFNKESNKYKFSEILKNLKFRKEIVDNLQLTRRKRKRDDFGDNKNYVLENDKKNPNRGRIKKNLNRFEIHDKMCPDNIIKKVKSCFFKYILFFVNNLLSSSVETCSSYNVQLLKLHSKYYKSLKKEKELEFLSMSLQDFFSKEISPKYKFSKDFNKKLIEHILDNKCNDTISFAFQMTLRDWLDFFTLKKNLKDIINENNNINYQNIDSEIIEKSLVGVEKLLYRIKKKNVDEDYLAHFILCLYNYERWFSLKKSRNRYKKDI